MPDSIVVLLGSAVRVGCLSGIGSTRSLCLGLGAGCTPSRGRLVCKGADGRRERDGRSSCGARARRALVCISFCHTLLSQAYRWFLVVRSRREMAVGMELVNCSEPVLGVRVREVRSDGRLCTVFWPVKWKPGINHASCDPEDSLHPEDHETPQADCTCGIYAYRVINHRDLAFYEQENVVGWHDRGVGPDRTGGGLVARRAGSIARGRSLTQWWGA